MGALSFFFMFASSPSYSFSMLLNVSNAFFCNPGVLGVHGFIVFMVSFVLFVSTLVALTNAVDLTNANGGFHREDGKEEYREREWGRTRKIDRQNRHRGDSNPVYLLNRSDTVNWCRISDMSIGMQSSSIQRREIQTYVDTS